MPSDHLEIRGARVHNLKGIDLRLPHNQMVVVTGVSGSGKSSLVFHLIYAEGRRRYVEALSSYARQFLERIDRPEVDEVTGVSPTVALRQKNTTRNPVATVATTTEIADFLRLLFARAGRVHCRGCGRRVTRSPVDAVTEKVLSFPDGTRFFVMFPIDRGPDGWLAPPSDRVMDPSPPLKERLASLRARGFNRLYQGGKVVEFSTPESLLDLDLSSTVWVLVDRLAISPDARERVAEAVEKAYRESGRVAFFKPDGTRVLGFSQGLACDDCGIAYRDPDPRWFSLQTRAALCPRCLGRGQGSFPVPGHLVESPHRSLLKKPIPAWTGARSKYARYMREMLDAATRRGIPLNVPYEYLSDDHKQFLEEGGDGYRGIRGFIDDVHRGLLGEEAEIAVDESVDWTTCPECRGLRFSGEVLRVLVGGERITDLLALSLDEALQFFSNLRLEPTEQAVAKPLLREILGRLQYLVDVGLHYLTLDRQTATLSGGEAQRIQLAGSLGSKLVGVSYVLDEPSIGLHCRDISQLVRVLHRLRDLGNTIFVVEHDAEIMRNADYLVDLGPAGGERGGNVIFAGPASELSRNSAHSVTGQYLTGTASIPVPHQRRKVSLDRRRCVTFRGASINNLKSIDVRLPLGAMVAITGVSGSGKSTLLENVLFEGLQEAARWGGQWDLEGLAGVEMPRPPVSPLKLDQTSADLGSRSTPITYMGVFDLVRAAFANTKDATRRGLNPSHFSFNVQGGRCPECKGSGRQTVDMQFLADVELICDACNGRQFQDELLEVRYLGKNIREVLDLTVDQAVRHFWPLRMVEKALKALSDVGLGYLRLGQRASELSGGEVQRLRLAKIANGRSAENALLLFDEPTTGLHFADIKKLLGVFDRLIGQGTSVVLIEHHLDVIKCADWVIDLGPEGGDAGGEIVAEGPPEVIAQCERSHTGRYLREVLN